MNINGICTYETPCGWCTKWDKKCDKKIGRNSPSMPIPEKYSPKMVDGLKPEKPCVAECDTYF